MSQIPHPRKGLFYINDELEEILTQSESEDKFIDAQLSNESDKDSSDEVLAAVLQELVSVPDNGRSGDTLSPQPQPHEEPPTKEIDHNLDWQKIDITPNLFPFDASKHNIPDFFVNCSKYDCFQVYFGEEITEFIVSETNIFHNYVIQHKEQVRPHSRLNLWTDTSQQEMHRFFALNFLMSRVKKLQIQEYCFTEPLLEKASFHESNQIIKC